MEEPAASFFSFTIFLIELYILFTLLRLPSPALSRVRYPVVAMTVVWAWTYLWSTLFHIRETVLTERMDYFSSVLGWLYMAYAAAVHTLSLPARWAAWLGAGLALWALYFLHYMLAVSFDYGFAVRSVATVVVAHLLLYSVWCFRCLRSGERPLSVVLPCAATHLMIAMACPLELNEINPPIWQTFDSHSLWHAAGNPISLAWGLFLIREAKWAAGNTDGVLGATNVKLY